MLPPSGCCSELVAGVPTFAVISITTPCAIIVTVAPGEKGCTVRNARVGNLTVACHRIGTDDRRAAHLTNVIYRIHG
jgi:hypothetical protein